MEDTVGQLSDGDRIRHRQAVEMQKHGFLNKYPDLYPHQERYIEAFLAAERELFGVLEGGGKSFVRKAVVRYINHLEANGE